MNPKDIQRFMSKVKNTNNCWIWLAGKQGGGYGQFRVNGKTLLSHRISYELFKDDIPYGLELDHLCRVRHCVNPEHLEVVTSQENTKRGELGLINKLKTQCKNGHEYNEKNTYKRKTGKRQCRECHRIENIEYKRRVYAKKEK